MAKTFRRRNKIPLWLEDENEKNKYHSDSGLTWRIPSRFRKALNRSFRSKNNQILKRVEKNGIDNITFLPAKKTAGWLYW